MCDRRDVHGVASFGHPMLSDVSRNVLNCESLVGPGEFARSQSFLSPERVYGLVDFGINRRAAGSIVMTVENY